jgi:hypothetical protein
MICIFDCETIPDYRLISQTFTVEDLSEYDAILKAQEEYREKHNSTFLPLAYHRVVAISAVIADEFGHFVKVGDFGKGSDQEEDIIRDFFSYIEKQNPKLVSFNGRGFDMPMLLIRAMKYNMTLHAYFDQNNPQLNKSKWENYRQRYSEHFHTDLLDSLGSFGAVRNLKLDTLCTMAGIPGKYDVSGDQVLELFYQGELEKIREYCQSDVLNTYWLYLKYELLKGTLTIEDYYTYLDTMGELLPKRGYYKVFKDAIEKELERAE